MASDVYATEADLLLGDLQFAPGSADAYLNAAADEIAMAIGVTYVLPLTPISGEIPEHVTLRLKRINILIASGRMILARAGGAEDDGLHAYGLSLLQEGQTMLAEIANGRVTLINATKIQLNVDDDASNAPSLFLVDSASPVEAFNDWMHRSPFLPPPIPGEPYWKPGA